MNVKKMRQEYSGIRRSVNTAYFFSRDERPTECDAGIMELEFEEFPGPITKTVAKKLVGELTSRFMAIISRSIEIALKPYLQEGESLFLSYGKVILNSYWIEEISVDLVYRRQKNGSKISGPIFGIDLIGHEYYAYKTMNKDCEYVHWLSEERPELVKKAEEVLTELLRAVPWIESSLSGNYLRAKRL